MEGYKLEYSLTTPIVSKIGVLFACSKGLQVESIAG